MSGTQKSKHLASRFVATLVAAGVSLLVGIGIYAPAAQAASYTYVNDLKTGEGVVRDSGLKSVIRGGTAKLSVTFGQSWIVTYRPAPGYSEVGFAVGENPQIIRLGHVPANNVHSKCFWSYPNVGGTASLTCTYSN